MKIKFKSTIILHILSIRGVSQTELNICGKQQLSFLSSVCTRVVSINVDKSTTVSILLKKKMYQSPLENMIERTPIL